jgi:hypothetical protein
MHNEIASAATIRHLLEVVFLIFCCFVVERSGREMWDKGREENHFGQTK